MNFSDIKKYIEDNEESILSISPTFPTYTILCEMLRRIDEAIKAPEGQDPEPLDDNLRNDINCALDHIIEAVISAEITEKERVLLERIVLIYSNFSELYSGCLDRPILLRVLSLLLATSRTIESSILLATYLLNKAKSWFVEENATTQLSGKYFNEYMAYLKDKTHNDDYSIR